MSQADDRLAVRVTQKPLSTKAGRRYRCGGCGLMFVHEDLNPDFDEDGRRVGWICDNCY